MDFFGGRNPNKDFIGCSNIFFSNGKIDPWRTGGQLSTINELCQAQVIEGAAHHLDLRAKDASEDDNTPVV